jgi:dynein heavy chain, axonemal
MRLCVLATVIYWCRQLKDVLNSQDISDLDETAGPLEEIDFWKARSQNLLGISKQLNKKSVKKITSILDLAKSSYISSFHKLSKQIEVYYYI